MNYLLFRGGRPHLERFARENPDDPAAAFIAADRSVIGRLIPLLTERAIVRGLRFGMNAELFVPRIQDVALGLIEYHSRCRFFSSDSSRSLSDAPDGGAAVRERVAEWWELNRNRSLTEGIWDQIPHADVHPQVEMAEAILAIEGRDSANGAKALDLLRNVAVEKRSARVAERLAEYGDLSPVAAFTETWKGLLDVPHPGWDSEIARYLGVHGSDEQWHLLCKIARKLVDEGWTASTHGDVLYAVVGAAEQTSSSAAVPCVATILGSNNDYLAVAAAKQLASMTDFEDPCCDQGYDACCVTAAKVWWSTTGVIEFPQLPLLSGF